MKHSHMDFWLSNRGSLVVALKSRANETISSDEFDIAQPIRAISRQIISKFPKNVDIISCPVDVIKGREWNQTIIGIVRDAKRKESSNDIRRT